MDSTDIPIVNTKLIFGSPFVSKASTTPIPKDADFEEVTADPDTSSTSGQSESLKRCKMDPPSPTYLEFDEINKMGVLERFAKAVLAEVHPTADDLSSDVSTQLPEEPSKLTDREEYSYVQKF